MTQTTSPNTATDTGPRHVDPKTASAWLTASQAALIDVREPAEFAAEHIAGAMLVPLSKFDARQLPDTGGQKLVLQCKSGARARQACARLAVLQSAVELIADVTRQPGNFSVASHLYFPRMCWL